MPGKELRAMAELELYVGIDVSKARLDVALGAAGEGSFHHSRARGCRAREPVLSVAEGNPERAVSRAYSVVDRLE